MHTIKWLAIKVNANDSDIVILIGDFNLSNVKYCFNDDNELKPCNFKPKFRSELFNDINSLVRQINYVENP